MAKGLAEILRFGRYEPLFRIGIGGMAEVYAARIRGEAGFQKLVAVKRMLPHLSGDQRFVNMFLDEARLAASITSPHVVQTLDLGRADDDSLYIVMELAVGVTLADIMRWHADRNELVDPVIALELLAQAAQGLDDAHEARAPTGEPLHLVHRDVSPQNILVGLDGRARVSDFGIAHAVHLRRTHTQVGEKKGKFSYYSPEQAFGQALDRRSDIFALGIVGWELLSGRRLFRGTMQEALLAVRERPIPHLSQVRPDLPAEIQDAVMHALERDLDLRFPTAGQMAAALRRAGLGLGDPAAPRAIGRFVQEVGGAALAQMQERIAGAGSPTNVTGTALLPVGEASGDEVSYTRDLRSGDLIELPTAVPSAEVIDEGTDVTNGAASASATVHPIEVSPARSAESVHALPTAPGRGAAPDASTTAAGKRAAAAPRPEGNNVVPLPGTPMQLDEDTETTVEEPSLAVAPTRIMTPTNVAPVEARPPRRVPILAIAVVAAIVLVLVGGVAAWLAGRADEGPIARPIVEVPAATAEPAVPVPDEAAPPQVASAGSQVEDEPAAEGDTVDDETAGDETAAEPAAVEAPEPRHRDRDRRRRRHVRVRHQPSAGAERDPVTREATSMTDTPPRGASPLPGLDAFDRSVQH